ncbi:MAG: hypothetical protein VXZ82_15680 [Planctomycetota bacterium]|nr:hypothetical protein [Planctomycetota bacterium]
MKLRLLCVSTLLACTPGLNVAQDTPAEKPVAQQEQQKAQLDEAAVKAEAAKAALAKADAERRAKLAEAKNAAQIKAEAIAQIRAQALRAKVAPQQAVPLGARAAVNNQDLRSSARYYSFYNLSEAKFDGVGNEPKVVFMVDSYRNEQETRTVTVSRTEMQKKRVLETVDGEEVVVEQMIPVQKRQEEERTYTVRKPAGKKPIAVSLDKVKFYDLDGKVVEGERLKEILAQMSPVFVYHSMPGQVVIPAAHKMMRKVINPDTLVAVTMELRSRPVPPMVRAVK